MLHSRTTLPLVAIIVATLASVPFLQALGQAWQSELPMLFAWEPRVSAAFVSSALLAGTVAVGATLAAGLSLPFLFHPRAGTTLAIVLALIFCLSPVVLLHGFTTLPGFSLLPPFARAAVVLGWKMIALAAALLLLGLRGIGRGELESGLLAASPGVALRRLVLPRLLPAALAGVVVTFVLVFVDGELPGLVGYRNLPEEVLVRITLEGISPAALLPALPMVLLALGGAASLMALAGRESTSAVWNRADRAVWQVVVQRVPGAGPAGWLLAALLLLPVGLVTFSALPALPSLEWAEAAAVLNSVVFALAAASAAAVFGYLAAEGLATLRNRWLRAMLLVVLCAQWMTPGYVPGAGMAELAIRLAPILDGDRLLVVTHAIRVLPLAVLAFLAFHWMNRRHDPAAELAGIGWWRCFLRLRLPVEWPAWLLVVAVLAALLLSELASTLLVVAPGTETAVLRIYNLMHYGAGDRVALLALLQTLVVLAALLLASRWMGRALRWA